MVPGGRDGGLSDGLHQYQGSTTLKQNQSVLADVDDIIGTQTTTAANQQTTQQHGSKLQHANEVAHKTEQELQSLCDGLSSRVSEIGILVAEAQQFQGTEKIFNFFGKFSQASKNKAAVMRHDRLQRLNLSQAVKEIKNYVSSTISQLGESEQEYKTDLVQYQGQLDLILRKSCEATPKYLDAQSRRQALEAEVQGLVDELRAGTVDQADRPAKETLHEDKKRQLDATLLEEKTLLAIVKEAKEALPEVQKSRDAAAASIQSIHAMRQSMVEKFNNFETVLSRAVTAMKARARLELYQSVDPALNKTIHAITENNVSTAGAALEVWAERAKHAAIDPQESQRLLQELLGHLDDAFKDLNEMEDTVKNTPNQQAAA